MKPKSPGFVLIAVLLIASLISSCASTGPHISSAERKKKEEEFNLKFLQASEKWLPRVYRIGYQLITSHVPEHGNEKAKFWFAGIGIFDLKDYARKAYGIDKKVNGVLVLGTYPESKAEGVDLKLGDVVEKVNGKKTKNPGGFFKAIRKSKQPEVNMDVLRQGKRFQIEVPLEKVYYNAQFFLAPTPDLEADSMFSRINIGIGAIRYCRNDDELAVIMGHELAHTTLKHSLKKAGTSVASGVGYGIAAGVIDVFTFPGVGGAIVKPMQMATDAAVSRRYEREADYFGMKHAFHSGYDIENGSRVFSRLATDAPSFTILAYTFASHPMTSERFLRLEKMTEEFKTQYPAKFPLQKSPDWEIVIPVQPGETQEEALERLLKEKGVEVSKPLVGIDLNQGAEPQPAPLAPIDQKPAALPPQPATPVTITLVEPSPMPVSAPLLAAATGAAAGVNSLSVKSGMATTSEISTASPASLGKGQASGYPEPKKL